MARRPPTSPFNPERFTGKNGAFTPAESSRLQDLIKHAFDDLANQIRNNFLLIPAPVVPGATGAPSDARYWLSVAVPALPNGVDMGALGSGILEQVATLGVSTPSSFLGTQGSVLFLGPAGALAQNNVRFFWDNANDILSLGTNAPDTGATGIRTRLFVYGTVPSVGGLGHLRQIIQNTAGTGLAALVLVNDAGIVNTTPYGGGGAALYYTGTSWGGNEGPNKVVLMAPNPGIVTNPGVILGITGHRKAALEWVNSATTLFRVYNPDVASAGGNSALVVDNNQSGVSGALVVSGHTSDILSAPYSVPDAIYLVADGGPLYFMTNDIIRGTVDPAGDWFINSLAAGGYVAADMTTGKLVIAATPVPASRTVQGTAPISIAGGHSAVDLSANRVWSHDATGVTPGSYTNADITVDAMGHITAAANGTPGTGFVPESRTITAGAGLTGGGDLSANRTIDAVANADGTIIVNANDIQVGVIQTANIADDAVTNAKLRNSVATSVIGRAGGSTGDPGDVVAAVDGQVLWRDGGGLGFAFLPHALASFSFVLIPAEGSSAALVVDARWLSMAQADGAEDNDANDERAFPFASLQTASRYSITVLSTDGDGRQVDSGTYRWDFELLLNTSSSIDTVSITSGGSGAQVDSAHGSDTFAPGDYIGVRCVGVQLTGTSTNASLRAFVTVVLRT